MELRTVPVGEWRMNAYSLICPHTQASVLIDPGAEPDQLMSLLVGSCPVAILLTHTHPDHIGALEEMRARLHVPVFAHAGPHFNDLQLSQERSLYTGDMITIGDSTLHVFETPGHCDDQLCFAVDNTPIMIVGDTLFVGGPGGTRSIAAFQTTLVTLRNVVLAWPDETICYPGHFKPFRLGDLRGDITQFLGRDHDGFFGEARWNRQ